MRERNYKILIIVGIVGLTVAIHYGLILEPIFGQSHWIHAIHGRFCYIPIVIGATLFGLRGGIIVASTISIAVMPFILNKDLGEHNLAGEFVELIFYYAIAILTGALIGRQLSIRKKQEETQLQLERSHKLSMVGQMAAGVAHEIKNPLASIKGAYEIICDKNTPEKDREEFSQIVSSEIKRIDDTVKGFLEFARPKESKFEKLNISDTISSSIKQIEAQLHEKNIKLKDNIQTSLFIRGDGEKIHQAALNLILNAVEASDSGSVINVDLAQDKNDIVLFTIKDNGSGISVQDLEKVFEPFFSSKTSGTGLGLAIVKAIIDNHDGQIHIESKADVGTEVSIVLPVYKERS
jgi:two-component system, NtrC family, sensor histidine kinase HydH